MASPKKKATDAPAAKSKSFPTFPLIVFIIASVWLLDGMGLISINLPWIPLALLVISGGWLYDHYRA